MKKNKKLWIIIVVIFVVVFATFFFLLRQKKLNENEKYEVESATTMNLQTTFTAKGNLKGTAESKLFVDNYYPVEKILVSAGDEVKKNQKLAELDISELIKQYELAKAEEEYYKEKCETAEALYTAGAIAWQDFNDAEYVYSAAVQKTAIYDIENKGEILSPIDGTVTAVNCSIGSSASTAVIGLPAFVIEDRSSILFKARVNEKDSPLVYTGQPVRILMDTAENPVLSGTVTKVSPAVSVDYDTGKNIVEVEITLNESLNSDITGITGKAEFFYEKMNVTAIPVNAIRGSRGDTRVYKILDDGSVTMVPVSVGISNDEYVEITAGEIEAGDYVVMNPEKIPATKETLYKNFVEN